MAGEIHLRRAVSGSASLAPPENHELTRKSMERSPSMTMRAEKEDLKEAAEDTYNVIMDLNLDGKVRWVSPSWDTVIGTPKDSIQDKPISDILVDDKDAFQRAIDVMKNDDSRSYKLRFTVAMGSLSTLSSEYSGQDTSAPELGQFEMEEVKEERPTLSLEGQGILIYDRATGNSSHTMWVIRPHVEPTEITIDLPPVLVESLGVGAGMLARYLTSLAEQGAVDPENNPPPLPVLCRICERQIQPWWFEKHSELCMLEHKAESDVQLCQENLGMHRQAIVKILDAMERRQSRPVSGEFTTPPTPVDYRGLPIGPSSSSSSGAASPGTPPPRSRDHSASGRPRSFAPRRPLVRIVELLLDLCDTSIEISTPAIKDAIGTVELGSFRTQSPESEARINQVMQWQSPTTNTLEEEKGLALLCSDTEAVARAKVEAVFRHRNTIEYSERIRLEFSMLVQDCIDEALRKAAEASNNDDFDDNSSNASEVDDDTPFLEASFDAALQRSNSMRSNSGTRLRRHSSVGGSGTSSPMECATPKSQQSLHRAAGRRARYSHRSSMQFEAEGGDSDTSARSSLAAAIGHAPTDSPVSDHELTTRIGRNSRLFSGSANSPKRQASPARIAPSSSPLRISKPRTSLYETLPTPITSPLLSTGDFSPALEHSFHHRRQSSATISDQMGKGGTSPRLSGVDPSRQNRAVPPSIKDFEIIKPISKGAFGSVYLSKKKSTGDYFAIKVLKKADMIAKNQVTNVRAERAIMMVQGESEFVAKLFWTFASKDYLYLVMEYLNGGDCAALIKILGGLPEDWAKKYMAEVVMGVENLHGRGIVHRDLKPDNLLIDQKGHLKLTDFGLSRMGLIRRQKRAQTQSSESTPDLLKQGPFSRSKSIASSRSTSFDYPGNNSPGNTPSVTPDTNAQLINPSYFNLSRENTLSRENSLRRSSNSRSDAGGSDHLATMLGNFTLNDPTGQSLLSSRRNTATEDDVHSESSNSSDFSALGLQHVTSQSATQSHVQQAPHSMMPPPLALFNPDDNNNRKFVGTPDYLAPETINGTGQDETSDWWSVGCIMFEFFYGYPPFHADTPEEVFEKILNRRIAWPDEEDDDASPEAKDLMNRLMCSDQQNRLGVNGGGEVRDHPFFADINWDTLLEEEPQFVPTPQNPEDTEYFDARGATLQSFVEEMEDQSTPASTPGTDIPDRPHDAVSRVKKDIGSSGKRGLIPLSIPPHVREGRNRRLSEPAAQDDFGNFAFKNLPVLDKANKDVIQKLRTEALKSTPALATSNPSSPSDNSPINGGKPLGRALSTSSAKTGGNRSVSPSNVHTNGQPRASQPSSPLLVSFTAQGPTSTADKRKSSTASQQSNLSQPSSSSSMQSSSLIDIPRLHKSSSVSMTSSPVKLHPKFSIPSVTSSPMSTSPTKTSQDKQAIPPATASQKTGPIVGANPRVRSLTVGSADSETSNALENFRQVKRRSQVFDMSPSSSDNEDVRSSALLRVQRRRQSARRMSNISFPDNPVFRPLDILVCEDHPVSRMVMERLLEKLKCRTIVVENGAEAMRYAMGEVKFDIILMEFKLPQINGEDVARMIRTSRNPNSSTPIVAVTGYLKDLADPQHFDELMEKPATPSKLIDVLERVCCWKPPPPDRSEVGQRSTSLQVRPTHANAGRMSPSVDRFMSGARARDSDFSSTEDDSMFAAGADPEALSRATAKEWQKLNVGSTMTLEPEALKAALRAPPQLSTQETAPARLQSAMDRIPSPLSTHVTAIRHDDTTAPLLPSPPEMVPLPPSMASSPHSMTPAGDRSKSPLRSIAISGPQSVFARQNSLEKVHQISNPSPSREDRVKSGFSTLFSGKDKEKEREKEREKEKEKVQEASALQVPSTSPDFKAKQKRSSLEKKKEKQGKQRREGMLADEADADDEDSLSGGKKPSKSRSIGEMIRNVGKKATPDMHRTKSNDGRSGSPLGREVS